jgi:hypothetical protein
MLRITRLAALAVALFAIAIATPAGAFSNQVLHFAFQRALVATPLDSTLVTLSQTSFDTTAAVGTSELNPTSIAAIDSNNTSGTVSALGSIAHAPVGSMWLVVEVTGSMQSMDSLYVGYQLSQGSTPAANGSSGNQNNWWNWRWYNGALTSAGGLLVNSTGSQTFVYPVPAIPSSGNAYVTASQLRFIIQGDNTSAAKAFSTRAWLVTR